MEMTINIADTSPKPRVINVRQYAAGVDKISFMVESCPIAGDVAASVVGTRLKQDITARREGKGISALWEVASDFTAKSGCFDIQLRLEGSGKVWLSDVMLLIVSESTEGSIQAAAPAEQIITAQLNIDAIIQQDIIFEYEEE